MDVQKGDCHSNAKLRQHLKLRHAFTDEEALPRVPLSYKEKKKIIINYRFGLFLLCLVVSRFFFSSFLFFFLFCIYIIFYESTNNEKLRVIWTVRTTYKLNGDMIDWNK